MEIKMKMRMIIHLMKNHKSVAISQKFLHILADNNVLNVVWKVKEILIQILNNIANIVIKVNEYIISYSIIFSC